MEDMRKKKRWSSLFLCIVMITAVFAGAGIFFAANSMAGNVASEKITLEKAREKALADANLKASDVVFTKEKRDMEDGFSVYEIDFYAKNAKYKYEIRESTGEIYSKSKESFSEPVPQEPVTPEPVPQEPVTQESMPQEPVTPEPAPQEPLPQEPASQEPLPQESAPANSDIGIEQAKAIAAGHAGFSVADVHFSKVKYEKDYGTMAYEIEFYKDGMEYEYEIDASNGNILEFDAEWDD